MVDKIEGKLIRVTMISLLLVFASTIVLVGIFNYVHILREADSVLDSYSSSHKTPPVSYPPPPPVSRNGRLSPFNLLNVIEVSFNSDDTIEYINFKDWDAGTKMVIVHEAKKILDGKDDRGFVGFYRYCRSDHSVYFISLRESLSNFTSSLLFMALAALLCSIAVLILVKLFSHRIIKPIIMSYEKQKRFITDAGHEIKTPLAVIEAACSVLELEKGESEWTEDIKKQVARLTELTNDLVFLSKMEEDDGNFAELPLSEIVSDAVSSFSALARKEGKRIDLQVKPDLIEVSGDARLLERLVYILLDNAMKYSLENSVIKVFLGISGRYASLAVRNMTEENNLKNLESIFDRFYRADSSRNSAKKGFGIGLAIAKAITERHRGRISASEEERGGMKIEVLIPLKEFK